MQVHYNLLATGGKTGRHGTSPASGLRLTDGAKKLDPPGDHEGDRAGRTTVCGRRIRPRCATGPRRSPDVTKRFGEGGRLHRGRTGCRCATHGTPVPGTTPALRPPGPPGPAPSTPSPGHMANLLGRSIKIEAQSRLRRTARTLLDIPVYNFDDQAIHPLATPLAVKPGRHVASHLYPRRQAAQAAAPVEHAATPVRGVGRRHQRRDVPGAWVIWSPKG